MLLPSQAARRRRRLLLLLLEGVAAAAAAAGTERPQGCQAGVIYYIADSQLNWR
jgi:hypothetical protein